MRYSLVSDDDAHWYIIPADKHSDWDVLIYEYDEDPESVDWVYRIGGHPSAVTFENPQCWGEDVNLETPKD